MTRRDAMLFVALLTFALGTPSVGAQVSDPAAAAATAREAARSDRHEEAIKAFQQAIAAAPERRREWLLEFADQHTWSGRLDEAVVLYREALETDDRAAELRARVGLARALSWDGRHAGALTEYRHALELDPKDSDALRGIARVQSWLGRHREAAARMREFLLERPRDHEATLILAESLAWMGRPDLAEPVLHERLAADRNDHRAASMLDRLEFERRPEVRLDWREFNQSDHLDISEGALSSRFYLAGGRGHIGPRYSFARYRPPTGPVEEIQVQRPGVESRYRISDALDWHGNLSVDLINTHGAQGDHQIPTYDTYFTYWPNDLLRFDAGSSRWTFDSEATLRNGLAATQAAASMDVLPDDRTLLAARISETAYTDGNRRFWWQLQAERRMGQNPRFTLGYRHTRFDFQTPGQRGYFNPDRYSANEALFRASGWVGGYVDWDLRVTAGHETAQPNDSRMIVSGGASVVWKLHPRLRLELAYDHSTSRTSSSGGFERGILRMTLGHRF